MWISYPTWNVSVRGIPSLIFSSKSNDSGIHASVSIEEVEQMSELQKFVLEVLDGRRIHDGSVRKFDMFSSIFETHLVWWPLCYIFCILDLHQFSDPIIILWPVHATRTETGLDWKLIVAVCPIVKLHIIWNKGTRELRRTVRVGVALRHRLHRKRSAPWMIVKISWRMKRKEKMRIHYNHEMLLLLCVCMFVYMYVYLINFKYISNYW